MNVSANKGDPDNAYVIGVDFGTLSARALVVRVSDGGEAGTAVRDYTHGVIDRELGGRELPPDWALQDPGDYTEALSVVVPAAISDAGIDPGQVGLGSAATEVVSFAKRPPRQAGTIVKDEGDGGGKAAEFLAAQKFI